MYDHSYYSYPAIAYAEPERNLPEQSLALPPYVNPKLRRECETCFAACDDDGWCPMCDYPSPEE